MELHSLLFKSYVEKDGGLESKLHFHDISLEGMKEYKNYVSVNLASCMVFKVY